MQGKKISEEEFAEIVALRVKLYENFQWRRFRSNPLRHADYFDEDAEPNSKRDFSFMFFDMSRDEFTRESANHINFFVKLVKNVTIWSEIISELPTRDDQWEVYDQFLRAPATLALLMPQAMREKFFYYFSHLANEVRRLKGGPASDDLGADNSISERTAERYKHDWARGGEFIDLIRRIGGDHFAAQTEGFRNSFSHRITPNIGWGISHLATRNVVKDSKSLREAFGNCPVEYEDRKFFDLKKGERAVYRSFGYKEPISFDRLTEALVEQVDRIHACNDVFRDFVKQCEEVIEAQSR